MREPADACMKTIVHSTDHGYKHLLILLLERAMGSSRNGVLRAACVQYITLALLVWNRSIFTKRESEIRNMLSSCLSDRHGDTRMRARQCFKAFEIHFPGQARSLRDSTSSSIQKQLDSTVLSCDFAEPPSSRPVSSSSSSSSSRPTSSSSSRPTSSRRPAMKKKKKRVPKENPSSKTTNVRRAPLRTIQHGESSSPAPSSTTTTTFSSGALRVQPRLEDEEEDEEEQQHEHTQQKSQQPLTIFYLIET